MDRDELSVEVTHSAIINGCYRLIAQREELNRINVFPVADGDTGDNMASVCAAIIEYSEIKEDIKLTIGSIAQAAIIGSRGNSGILFTQFFLGLHQHLDASKYLTIHNFSAALEKVGEEIDSVLSAPVEGTIITLIKKLAIFVASLCHDCAIVNAMRIITPQLNKEVEKTSISLQLLNESHVVDAGALGFYYFIEGFTDFLVNENALLSNSSSKIPSFSEHFHQLNQPPEFRYCTEAVLKKPLITQQALLEQFSDQANSIVAIGTADLLKIHLHTNDPSHLFSTLYQLGTVKYPKVDDMQRQYEIQCAKKHTVALVTDSSADLPQELLDKYQIHTIPLNIHIADHDFLDKYSFEPNYFYKQLQDWPVYPKTSCGSPYQIKQYLNRLLAQYDHVLILSISSAMSGMHSAFVQASKGHSRITILDTKMNSAAHGLLLYYAGQLIAEKRHVAEVIQRVQAAIDNTFIFVLVNQFDSMIRSGRMSKWSAKFASWSHIKPIVSIDQHGRGVIAEKALSTGKGLAKLIQLVQKRLEKANAHLEDYAIVHADNQDDALHLAKTSSAYFSKDPLFINAVSLAIGLHAGKGCVAIAARVVPR